MAKEYFDGCKTMEQLKVEYRRLIKQNHPDNGGSISEMQKINSQYDELFNILKNVHNAKAENKENQNTERPEEFRNIIETLMRLDGLVLELCGSWIWVSGRGTYEHRATLKELGLKYASKKKMWYWGQMKRKSRRSTPMDKIRSKYGSEVYESEPVLRLS